MLHSSKQPLSPRAPVGCGLKVIHNSFKISCVCRQFVLVLLPVVVFVIVLVLGLVLVLGPVLAVLLLGLPVLNILKLLLNVLAAGLKESV